MRETPFKDYGTSEAAQGRTKTHKGILMAMPVEGGVSGRKRLADAQGCTETHRVAQIRTKSHKVSQTRTRSHRFNQKRTTLLKKLRQGYFCPKNGVISHLITLAGCSVVSRSFSEPAIRALWRHLPNLEPVWRLLSPGTPSTPSSNLLYTSVRARLSSNYTPTLTQTNLIVADPIREAV